MKISPTRLGHVVLRVRNINRSEAFYSGILGLEVKGRHEDKMVFLRSNPDVDHDLALVAIGEEAPGPDANSVGLYHFAYELGSFEELRDAYQLVVGKKRAHSRLRRPRRHKGSLSSRPGWQRS